MELQFIGATGTVTGSKYRIGLDDKNFLVDCGLYQGLKYLRLRNWKPFPFNPKKIDAVVLTHAHIDHTGHLPLLTHLGYHAPIYSTRATKALCDVLLPDSAFLQQEDAEFAVRHGFSRHKEPLPLYTIEDAKKALELFQTVDWRHRIRLYDSLYFEFIPAGHILGASIVRFTTDNLSITFSGDLGRSDSLTMKRPSYITDTDYLVLESTYGNRNHPDEDPFRYLEMLINRVVARGGILLIPSFAVGRTQQILHIINRLCKTGRIPAIPVYLDSPMAEEATRLFCRFDDDQAMDPEECREMMEMTRFVVSAKDSKLLSQRKEPAVVVSASGMATGGRVLHHLKSMAPNPKNCLLFVGYQAPGTRGESIVKGAGVIKIHGEHVPIRAEVKSLDSLSAHADSDEIMDWLRHFHKPPRRTFITHGEPEASEALRKRIYEELGWEVLVPDYLETFTL